MPFDTFRAVTPAPCALVNISRAPSVDGFTVEPPGTMQFKLFFKPFSAKLAGLTGFEGED
jgi:hypothetical protein